jgi:hypothetical protein
VPYSIYLKSEFWLNSPGLIVMKLGVVILFLAFAFVWTEYAVGAAFSWLRQLGTTSLLVYWVHIELVYGRWFGAAKENLSNVECAIWSVVVVLAMLGLSVVRTNWSAIWPAIRVPFLSYQSPRRVSGD